MKPISLSCHNSDYGIYCETGMWMSRWLQILKIFSVIYRGFDGDWDFVYEFPKQENCISTKAQVWNDDSKGHKPTSPSAAETVSIVTTCACGFARVGRINFRAFIWFPPLWNFHSWLNFSCCYVIFFISFNLFSHSFTVLRKKFGEL